MKNILFLFSLLSVLVNTPAFANCEAGGYMIHTLATYKKADHQVFAILADNKITLNAIDDTTELRNQIVGEYLAKKSGKACGKTNIEISGLDVYDGPQLALKSGDCAKITSKSGIYILIDKKEKQVLLGSPVSIEGPTLRPEWAARTKSLLSTTNLPGSSPEKMIHKSDILNLNSFPVHETSLGKSFSVLTAELHVKNVEKYFKDEGYAYYGKQYMNFEKVKVGYPVLFFASAGSLAYAGDGSHCSSVPVMYRNMDLVNREQKLRDPKFKPERGGIAEPNQFPKDSSGLYDLGVLERFNVTNAFDLDGDGKVDVIEINERFAYRLLPGLKFEVINFGMGC